MSYLKVQDKYRVEILAAYGTMEEAEAQEYKERILDALEDCRWSTDSGQIRHTVFDILEYLIRREQ